MLWITGSDIGEMSVEGPNDADIFGLIIGLMLAAASIVVYELTRRREQRR